ncbi:DUF4302 domain-containing protein [Pedobacter heparinus]|nr:DUF4302 domain-containing protein [Pedobacter heparinus]
MKKILTYIFLLTALMYGCKKDNDPILEDPDTRLSAELEKDQALLLSANDGWLATIYPKGGKGFSFYFKFAADGKVTMLSDFNTTTAGTSAESSYRLKALQRPTLIFDGYNYIHLPADPNSAVSGGSSTALGLTSDFEFAFTGQAGDTVKFEGTFNKNYMSMVKLSNAQAQTILAGGLKKMIDDANAAVTGKILFIMLDNKQIPVSLSVAGKSVSIAGQTSSAFAFGLNELTLKNPLKFGSYSFDKVYWEPTDKYFYFLNGNAKVKIEISPAPLPLETTPALHTVLGTRWTSMQINVANLSELSADFLAKYNAANTSLGTLPTNGAPGGRYIEYITLLFNPNGTVTFQIRYRNPASPSSFFNADFIYNMALDANTGIAKFTLAATPAGNASTIRTYVTALTDYFAGANFKIAYIAAGAPSGATVGGFLNQNNPASFFYGVLQQ